MLIRAISGAVYVALVIVCTLFGGGLLHIVFGILTILMIHEFCTLFEKAGYNTRPVITAFLGLTIYTLLIVAVVDNTIFLSLVLLFVLAILVSMIPIIYGILEIFFPTEKPGSNAMISIGALMYILPPMTIINAFSRSDHEDIHVFPLLGIFILIWCSDTFAYLIGRKFGKTKMAEKISPNKTWEGFTGGAIAAIIAGILIAYFLEGQPFFLYIILGLITSVFGLFGDLFESKIKRQIGVKDSGTFMPGHGGLLDRFDSVLFVMPVSFMAYFIYQLLQ